MRRWSYIKLRHPLCDSPALCFRSAHTIALRLGRGRAEAASVNVQEERTTWRSREAPPPRRLFFAAEDVKEFKTRLR